MTIIADIAQSMNIDIYDIFKYATWALLLLTFVVMLIPHHNSNVFWAAFEASLVFAIVNVGFAIYILTHPTNPALWTANEPKFAPPQLPEGRLIGEVTEPLNQYFGNVTDDINSFYDLKDAFEHAREMAQEYFVLAGWAAGAMVLFFIIAKSMTIYKAKREKNALDERISKCEAACGITSE